MRLVVAGGGTGGHLFPGIAVAEALARQVPGAETVFVGTERGIEARVIPELGLPLELINVSGLKTVGLMGAIRGALSIPGALWQSRKLLKRLKPDCVLGVGGYASGPVVLAARLMGIPTAIIEQNSIPGLANKILGKFVGKVFLSFDITRSFFKAKKIEMSGNPIRESIVQALTDGRDSNAGDGHDGKRIFIFGGSQGAKRLSELCQEALALLAERGLRPHIVHQTGKRFEDDIRQRYQAAGVEAEVHAFINDMASQYRAADLVIARSGATTVAELGVVGKPAILVPYPHAADNHQELNAKEMADAGAAVMLREADLSAEVLADSIAEHLQNGELLANRATAMRALGRPEAANTVAHYCASQKRV